ncbi:MAG: cytochrome d ubiquinol oxidase subunit II [Candidatus Nanopelagicales bacterium]
MDLQNIWFVIIAIFWVGFFVLEGFDLGVGMLHWFVGRDDTERRVAINAIGPFWDGNEVWLIVGGAAIFAAFPGWYATMFSSLYLALVLVLLALMARGVAFEYRGKRDSVAWRTGWSWALGVGSALIPLLLGVGLGDLLVGLPIDADQEYTGTFWNLLTPYGLLTGIGLLVLCLAHGASFLALKTTGAVRERSEKAAITFTGVSFFVVILWVLTTAVVVGIKPASLVFQVLAVLGVVVSLLFQRKGRDGIAFTGSAVGIGSVVAALFASLFPNVMVSSTNVANNLTIANTASGSYALTIMTWVAVIMFPIVLLYQGWTYYAFRRRVVGPPSGTEVPSGADVS